MQEDSPKTFDFFSGYIFAAVGILTRQTKRRAEKMKKFASKFEKYGTCEYIKSEPYICEDESSHHYKYEVVDIDVTASYKIGDYSFVAALEWVEEAKENLIKKLSEDIYVPSIYKTRRECDHCKTHRYRKSTILLQNNETKEYIQVGKTCVKDYTGIDLGRYACYLSFFTDLEEYLAECEKDNRERIKPMYKVEDILNQTNEEVSHHGYISKGKSYELDTDSTSSRIYMMLTDYVDYYTQKKLYSLYKNISDKSKEETVAVYKFYEELESQNDYVNNIKTILQTKYVDASKIGLVVSAVGTKLRLTEEKMKKEREGLIESNFVGQIGDRITFKAIPECVFSDHSEWGFFYIYKMKLGNDEIIWKTSKSFQPDIEIEITATIKAHEEFKGRKQTEITRGRTKVV